MDQKRYVYFLIILTMSLIQGACVSNTIGSVGRKPADTPVNVMAPSTDSAEVSFISSGDNRNIYGSLTRDFDFPLYKNEAWKGGSRESEIAGFLVDAKDVTEIQEALRKRLGAKTADRAFHPKQHGCLIGEMQILDTRPADADRRTFRGMFSGQIRSYLVLARFSNGSAPRADAAPDLRGMAIKVFGVPDDADQQKKVVDLLMTSIPNPPARDQAQFVEFMKAIDEPLPLGLRVQEFFLLHPLIGERIINHSVIIPNSVAELTYWSGHPYLLGPDDAMKFNIRPSNLKTPTETSTQGKVGISGINAWVRARNGDIVRTSEKLSYNFLREELTRRALAKEIRMTLSIQLEKNPVSTPIENALVQWTESASPSIPVAEVVFPRQHVGDAELETICQSARFTPGHQVSEHRPLSNIGRGRIFGYTASQNGRGASPNEIQEAKLIEIQKRIQITNE